FLFTPRWEDFNGTALFNAMGFCFFSLSLGAGTMITYGSYLNPKADLPSSVGWVAFLAILSSILGGLMVMPAVFAFHLDPTAGPGLTFVTMPAVFSQMPLGQGFAAAFYACLTVAALTSSVSMLEACTALLTQEANISRKNAILLTLAGCAIVGFAANMSFGPWSDVKLFG
ncbi:sodium-dependent transporter, partial [Campylobacter jejuni]|nr:sodium-dependent transporter [Campylobacter jejuni]